MLYLPYEIWRDVPGSKSHEFSSQGNLRKKKSGRLFVPGIHKGYLSYYVKSFDSRIHVLMAKCFPLNEPYYNGCAVHHINHNKLDNRPQNLMVMDLGEHTRLHMHGRTISDSHRKKISELATGRTAWNKGKKMSDEYRAKCKNRPTSKTVIQLTKDYKYICEYTSVRDAQRQTGVPNQNIVRCCKGKVKTAGGYIWKYKNEA